MGGEAAHVLIHLSWYLSWVIGGLFLASAVHKLLDLRTFYRHVLAYEVVPERLARTVSRVIPFLELTGASLLLTGWQVRLASGILLGLLLLFSIAIGLNLGRGRRQLDCGCGGLMGSQRLHPALILRNGLLGVGAIVPMLLGRPSSLPLVEWGSVALLSVASLLALAGRSSIQEAWETISRLDRTLAEASRPLSASHEEGAR